MDLKASDTRYAHTGGYTYCTYSDDGKFIITCGCDGDVRRWEGIDDDDASSKCLGEFVGCVAQYNECLLAATDTNAVYEYSYPELKCEKVVFRFTAQVTWIRVNEKYLAAGSEDSVIKVIKRNTDGDNEFELKGHKGPVFYMDISKNDHLASYSGDGTIKIWDLKTKEVIKTIDGFPEIKVYEAMKSLVTPSFEPETGNYLAYCSGNEIYVRSCNTWNFKVKLKHNNITDEYSYCAFSSNGQFIAAGTMKGDIVVFDFLKSKSISKFISNSELGVITSISWNPKNHHEFAYCDIAGHLGTVIIENNNNDDKESTHDSVDEILQYQIFDDNDRIPDIENDVDDNDNDNASVSNQSDKHSNVQLSSNFFTQQEPFQPGATPEDAHRYLVWNNVGIVRAHKADDGNGSIDVEFHDASLHHALHINNYMNHTMASLSSNVIALSRFNSSKVVCIALGSSVGSREWSIELPDCEGVMAIAATTTLVAIATDNRFVRLFSIFGTQRNVISIPGPVLAMCGYENKLMITYHSAPANENQHISAILLQTFGFTFRSSEIRVPITPGKKLKWIGYSDKGSPASYDTSGLLRMYSIETNCWYPVCDTTKHTDSVSENYYIIDVLESEQKVQAVLCIGCSYPAANSKSIVSRLLPMQLPLCEIDSDKSMLEDLLIRGINFSVDDSNRIIKETAIKLFALSCRTEMEARAKELIELIGSPDISKLAVKYSNKLGRFHLAQKLMELLPQLEEQEEKREEQERQERQEKQIKLHDSSQNNSFLGSFMSPAENKSRAATTATATTSATAATSASSITSPLISPKPMTVRNPFKKKKLKMESPLSASSKNHLSHLTKHIIGNSSSQYREENLSDALQETELQTSDYSTLENSAKRKSDENSVGGKIIKVIRRN